MQFLGHCNKPPVLIYEFMKGGDLLKVLRSEESRAKLSLCHRVLLMYQAALGLAFLHHGCKPAVRHWDIKPSNILLDGTLTCAKIGDLGIAKQMIEKLASQATGSDPSVPTSEAGSLRGTPEYLDPSYIRTRTYATDCDTYSYGLVLLQLLTGESDLNTAVQRSHSPGVLTLEACAAVKD